MRLAVRFPAMRRHQNHPFALRPIDTGCVEILSPYIETHRSRIARHINGAIRFIFFAQIVWPTIPSAQNVHQRAHRSADGSFPPGKGTFYSMYEAPLRHVRLEFAA